MTPYRVLYKKPDESTLESQLLKLICWVSGHKLTPNFQKNPALIKKQPSLLTFLTASSMFCSRCNKVLKQQDEEIEVTEYKTTELIHLLVTGIIEYGRLEQRNSCANSHE